MKDGGFRFGGVRLVGVVFAMLLSGVAGRFVQAETSPNLIVDGGGEAGLCSDDDAAVTTVPGWTVVKGSPSLLCYTAGKYAEPKGSDFGRAFFSGGPYGASELTQTIDVSSAKTAIDLGSTRYTLSGWMGGQAGDPGHVMTSVRFFDADGTALGTASKLPVVTNTDRGDRNAFLKRTRSNTVPIGTRSILVRLEFVDKADQVNAGYADNLSLTLSTAMSSPVLDAPRSTVPGFDHVFLVMMENTTYEDVVGDRKNAPYINHLADQGTLFTNASATYHPSDENYFAIAGGQAFVKGGVYFPDIRIDARHLGDQLEAAGKTWKGYGQGMGTPCGTSNQYDRYFEPDDLPFINFVDIRDDHERCQAHLVDASELLADLQSAKTTPNFAWLAADDYDDGEASYDQGGLAKSLQVQDEWLRKTLEPIFASAAWKTQRSLLILTWDESYQPNANHVATVLLGSDGMVRTGYQSQVPANHYSIGRTLEEALGITPMTANDRYARPLNEAFSQSSRGEEAAKLSGQAALSPTAEGK
jgi:hypothetical protein